MAATVLRNGPLFPTQQQVSHKLDPIRFQLNDKKTKLTAFPIYNISDVPESLISYMHEQFNIELKNGCTYPQYDKLTLEEYKNYWFHSFCCIVLELDELDPIKDDQHDNAFWGKKLFGTFYVKPNYSGRCSQTCNAGFFIPSSQRGQKLGRKLGQLYLKFAPKLGYSYSVFNLVFVSNPASWKIWDNLKFDRIGYVPKVAILGHNQTPPSTSSSYAESSEYEKTDAIIFGKDLTCIKEELFDDFNQLA